MPPLDISSVANLLVNDAVMLLETNSCSSDMASRACVAPVGSQILRMRLVRRSARRRLQPLALASAALCMHAGGPSIPRGERISVQAFMPAQACTLLACQLCPKADCWLAAVARGVDCYGCQIISDSYAPDASCKT